MEKLKIFWDMKNEGIKKLCKEYWYDKVLNESEYIEDYIPKCFKDDFFKYTSKRNNKSRYKYIMFTINFKDGVSFKDAYKKFEKYRKKKWIVKSMSCFEWRDGENGMHIHSKVWLDNNKKSYDCKREVYNTFKNLVGNKMHINVRYSNRDGCFDDYINGLKKGEMKKNGINDIELRRKYNINNILVSDCPTPVSPKGEMPST